MQMETKYLRLRTPVANVGLYVFLLLLLLVPVGRLTVTLEERELVDRFGEAYRQYQREVPPLIPRRLRVFSR